MLWIWEKILLRIVQITLVANETKADNTQAKLSVSSGFREKNGRFNIHFLVWFKKKDLKEIR